MALQSEASPAQLEWLGAAWFRLVRRNLERDMERAWFHAFSRTRAALDELDTTGDGLYVSLDDLF
jgi:hypothetical protein